MASDPTTTDDLTAWGWAPGEYAGAICHRCAIRHGGYAKGSWRCEPCARAARDTAAKRAVEPEGYDAELGALMCDHSPRDIAAEVLRLRALMERMITEVSRWSIAASEEMEAIYRGTRL